MTASDGASEFLTVPVDDAELLAESCRLGVRPVQRVHVAIVAAYGRASRGIRGGVGGG
jgi:hypothetical protein